MPELFVWSPPVLIEIVEAESARGFFDHVFIPGVSFEMGADGSVTPSLGVYSRGDVCH